jgi:hypothetical protein
VIQIPKDGPALRTYLADRGQQPARTQASAANYNGGSVVHLDLEAKYGSGKVVTDRDALTPGVLQMRILA